MQSERRSVFAIPTIERIPPAKNLRRLIPATLASNGGLIDRRRRGTGAALLAILTLFSEIHPDSRSSGVLIRLPSGVFGQRQGAGRRSFSRIRCRLRAAVTRSARCRQRRMRRCLGSSGLIEPFLLTTYNYMGRVFDGDQVAWRWCAGGGRTISMTARRHTRSPLTKRRPRLLGGTAVVQPPNFGSRKKSVKYILCAPSITRTPQYVVDEPTSDPTLSEFLE